MNLINNKLLYIVLLLGIVMRTSKKKTNRRTTSQEAFNDAMQKKVHTMPHCLLQLVASDFKVNFMTL